MVYGRKDTHYLFRILKVKDRGELVMRFTGTSYSRFSNKREGGANKWWGRKNN